VFLVRPFGRVLVAGATVLVAAFAAVSVYGFLRHEPPRADAAPVTAEAPIAPSASAGSDPPSAAPSASRSTSPTPRASRSPSRQAEAARTDNLASRLRTLPAGTRQVIVVHASGFGVSEAVLETFQKVNGAWQPTAGAVPARLGTNGFQDRKIEGDNATPTGVYAIGGTMYGIASNPGVRYRYHQLVEDDWWNENPASPDYNRFVHGADPGGASEALWTISPQYTHFAVINYNTPVTVADPPRGSGIFLHESVGRGTAGCVAIARGDLVRVLTWLDPAASPRIVMAPTSQLGRY
jgi:L,D-peptidoglycan transpeptidase YkuD (ErfK/YbiS/YcfS/YnhG family)